MEPQNSTEPNSAPVQPTDAAAAPPIVDQTVPASPAESAAAPTLATETPQPLTPPDDETPPAPAQPPASEPSVQPSQPTVMGGGMVGGAHGPATPVVATAGQPGRRPKKFLKPLLIAVAAVLVIGGGSAAAYFGVIVPNRPQNVLLSAFLNTAQKKQVTFNGTLHEQPAKGSGVALKADYNGQADAASKAANMHMNLTVSGVDFSIDARYVGKDLYFRLGDLKTIVSLLNSYDPMYGAMAKSLNSQVSNKWIKVDQTILDESQPVSCVLNTDFTLSDKDIDLLKTQYKQHPFIDIQSTSSDTVNGKKVEKFVLSMDDDKGAQFAKGLNDLSIYQALNKCETSGKTDTSSLADHDHTPLTVWVDKGSKEIVQVESHTTAQDAKKDNMKADTTVTLNYDKPVHITAPTPSTPVMQLLGDIERSMGGSSSGMTPTMF